MTVPKGYHANISLDQRAFEAAGQEVQSSRRHVPEQYTRHFVT